MTGGQVAGSVLIEVGKHKTLVDAAQAFFAGTPFAGHMQGYASPFDPADIEIDHGFPALPVGADLRGGLDFLDPGQSDNFIVRGHFKSSEILHRIARDSGGTGPVFHADPPIFGLLAPPHPTCGTSPAVGDTDTVRDKLHARELADAGFDGSDVAIAIVDSGIYLPRIMRLLGDFKPSGLRPNTDPAHSWKQHVVTEPFGHRLGHGTMCAYDALIMAPKATLLDYAILLGRPDDQNRIKTTLSAALRAYGRLIKLMRSEPWPYRALVVSNSWGTFHPSEDIYPAGSVHRYLDNPNHIFRRYVSALAATGADNIFAGNNCGCCCPAPECLSRKAGMIMGASSYPEVLTVGGCDTHDELTGYSSRGPSMAGMFAEKPDLVAYTHFLGSKTIRIFLPDSGVSAACPVAAGCVAALRTKLPPAATPPADLFDALRATARKVTGPGWDPGYGHGIIQPVAAARRLGLIA
jgi:subtilisin family serine protease